MKRTKEDLLFIKKVAEDNLAGAYDPHKLTKAVKLITGSDQLMHLSHKKQTLMGFFNYSLQTELKGFDKTELAVEPPTITGATHTEGVTNSDPLEPETVKIDLVKPKAKRKKRVTRKKTTKSNLNLDA